MLKLLEKIADFAYEYGKEGAGMPSLRGNYEAAAQKMRTMLPVVVAIRNIPRILDLLLLRLPVSSACVKVRI